MSKEIVVIIGCGIIGKSWAMLFASQGHEVRLFDSIPLALENAKADIEKTLRNLEKTGDLTNSINLNATQQNDLISCVTDLKDALVGATYVQENIPEDLNSKRELFKMLEKEINSIGNEGIIIGSSTSAICSSSFVSELQIRNRTLVVHPVNPPYFMRCVELVPNPSTNPLVTTKVRNLMTSLGQKPVLLKKEVLGFAQNRIQCAIANATWKLVEEDILSVEDADLVMKEGLAPRYIFMGPLETGQLNANGFLDYCERYGPTIYNVSLEVQGTIPKFSGSNALKIDRELQAIVPNSQIPQRRQWRDENLGKFAKFRENLNL